MSSFVVNIYCADSMTWPEAQYVQWMQNTYSLLSLYSDIRMDSGRCHFAALGGQDHSANKKRVSRSKW